MRKWVISQTLVVGGHGSLIAPAAVNNVSFSSIRNDKFQETVASFPGLPSNKVNFARLVWKSDNEATVLRCNR